MSNHKQNVERLKSIKQFFNKDSGELEGAIYENHRGGVFHYGKTDDKLNEVPTVEYMNLFSAGYEKDSKILWEYPDYTKRGEHGFPMIQTWAQEAYLAGFKARAEDDYNRIQARIQAQRLELGKWKRELTEPQGLGLAVNHKKKKDLERERERK